MPIKSMNAELVNSNRRRWRMSSLYDFILLI
jgi:hypothetical protein